MTPAIFNLTGAVILPLASIMGYSITIKFNAPLGLPCSCIQLIVVVCFCSPLAQMVRFHRWWLDMHTGPASNIIYLWQLQLTGLTACRHRCCRCFSVKFVWLVAERVLAMGSKFGLYTRHCWVFREVINSVMSKLTRITPSVIDEKSKSPTFPLSILSAIPVSLLDTVNGDSMTSHELTGSGL